MPEGNYSFDHLLEDDIGKISIQVKLQRSEKGSPVVTTGIRYGLASGYYMVEPQRTRGGTKRSAASGASGNGGNKDDKTRPYRYGEFDLIAVSLQPSTGDWSRFRYTVGNWLLSGKAANEIAMYQPVSTETDSDWTDDFEQAVAWFRSGIQKRISGQADPAQARRRARRANR